MDWNILGHVPFILMVNGKPKINTMRIIETIIMAVICGAFAGYISFVKMEVQVANFKQQMTDIKQKVDKIYDDFYKPIYPSK